LINDFICFNPAQKYIEEINYQVGERDINRVEMRQIVDFLTAGPGSFAKIYSIDGSSARPDEKIDSLRDW
jgi:hypothetical protein